MSPSAPPSATTRASGAPTPTPVATAQVTPTPLASFGSTPHIVRTLDATVDAASIAPALSSVAFASAAIGWAAGRGVILGTTDGGKSWRQEWRGSSSISSLSVVDRLHAWGLSTASLAPTASRLIRTADGGRTWTNTPVTGGFREIAFATDLVGWAVVGGIGDTTTEPGRLQATSDGGLHWHSSSLKARVDSVCARGPRGGWAASGSGVFRTLDGGGRWTRVTRGPNDVANSGWQATIRCAGSAAWVLWTGGAAAGSEAYRVARTLDGGAHWKIVLSQLDDALGLLPTIDAYAGSFATASATTALFLGWCPACGYGTWSISRTSDGGKTVQRTLVDGLTGASLADMTFPDAVHGWIAGGAAGGFLLTTHDGGRSWDRAYPSRALRPALDIAFVSPTVGFGLGAVGDGRAILRTADGGATWQSTGRLSYDPAERDRDPILSFAGADRGWVAIGGGVLSTRDGGHTWGRVASAPAGGVAFADVTHGCAGTFAGPAARTVDGGKTWQTMEAKRGLVACAASLVDPAWTAAAEPFDPGNLLVLNAIVGADHAWAVGSLDADHQGLAASTDGGATWTAYRWPAPPDGVGGLVPDNLIRASFVNSTTGWLFTLLGHLFETTDGGATWREVGYP